MAYQRSLPDIEEDLNVAGCKALPTFFINGVVYQRFLGARGIACYPPGSKQCLVTTFIVSIIEIERPPNLRHLEIKDYIPIIQVIDEWWGGRPIVGLLF
jgi:hypothetical protein